MIFRSLVFLVALINFSACDIEGEIKQGSISSTIAANSGAAGGGTPVLGGVYYDSVDGLTISQSGNAGQTLILNAGLEPEWVTAIPGGALPTSGGTMTGNIELNGNFLSGDSDSEGLFVANDGKVGVGTTVPIHELHVVGNAGKTFGGTTWAVISDERLKKNIRPLKKGLAEIERLQLKRFFYKQNSFSSQIKKEDVGLIAQQVLDIFPEAVMEKNGYYMLDFHPINMSLIKAVQDLSELNKNLAHKLTTLEARIEKLEKN